MSNNYDFIDSFIEEFEKEMFNDNKKMGDFNNENPKENKRDEITENDFFIIEDINIDEKGTIKVKVSQNNLNINISDFCFYYNEKFSNNSVFRRKPLFNIVNKNNNNETLNYIFLKKILSEKGFTILNNNYIIFENGSKEEGENILKSLGMEENSQFIKNYFGKKV